MSSKRQTIRERFEAHGFAFTHTGGNCTAFVRSDGQIEEYVVVRDDHVAPTRLNDVCSVSACEVGPNAPDTDDCERATCAEVLAALEAPTATQAEYSLLYLRLYNAGGRNA